MSLRKVIHVSNFLFLLALLLCSCGGESSTENTDSSETKVVELDNTPKVIATSNPSPEATEAVKEESKTVLEPDTNENGKQEELKVETKKEKNKSKERKKPKKRAKMHFSEKVFDFGFIMEGDTIMHDFYFKNVGNDDLMITRVEPSCGCTVPVFPREPIAAGEEGKISVMFKSRGKLGRQNPTISVFTNYKRKIKLELKGVVDTERAKPSIPKVETKVDTTQ